MFVRLLDDRVFHSAGKRGWNQIMRLLIDLLTLIAVAEYAIQMSA